MSSPRNNLIDILFKEELTTPEKHRDFVEQEWESMAFLLDERKKARPLFTWLYPVVSGIAAMLLLFFGWQYLKLPVHHKETVLVSTCGKSVNNSKQALATATQKSSIISIAKNIKEINGRKGPISKKISKLYTQTNITYSSVSNRDTNWLSVALTSLTVKPEDGKFLSSAPQSLEFTIDTPSITPVLKPDRVKVSLTGSRLSLAILAAPDVNGVNSFKGGQTGGSYSLQLSIILNEKLSLSTGAGYAIKPYQTSFSNYRTSSPAWWIMAFGAKNQPTNVTANCKVLDIPINLNYSFYHKGPNSFKIGTGLSSYFMLKESYRFNFTNPSMAPANLEINNQNQHYFGVVNINASYEHKVNSNMNLLIQPFAKLPVTQIGFGQVNLRSAGVAVGFSWNLKAFNQK